MGKNRTQIDGTIFDDVIMLGFIDGDGDMVTDAACDIFAYGGNDLVYAGFANDRIWGGEGNDTLNGGGGSDSLYGGTGDDELNGGAGADRLYGEAGDDYLFGGGSNDLLIGGHGNDTLSGGGGNDRLYGSKGSNLLLGGGGDDFISTGDHTSTADGGDGNDVFEVRTKKGGDHILTGGAGADEFQFIQTTSSAVSDMVITDYNLDEDSFSVDGVDGSAYLLLAGAGNIVSDGGDTVVHLLSGDTITFEGIDEAAFEAYFGLA